MISANSLEYQKFRIPPECFPRMSWEKRLKFFQCSLQKIFQGLEASLEIISENFCDFTMRLSRDSFLKSSLNSFLNSFMNSFKNYSTHSLSNQSRFFFISFSIGYFRNFTNDSFGNFFRASLIHFLKIFSTKFS